METHARASSSVTVHFCSWGDVALPRNAMGLSWSCDPWVWKRTALVAIMLAFFEVWESQDRVCGEYLP